VIDVHDDDWVCLVVETISDAVLTATGSPQSLERSLKRRTDPKGRVAEGSTDELLRRERGGRRQLLAQRPTRTGRVDDRIRFGLAVILRLA
jgi:hypothetical protein